MALYPGQQVVCINARPLPECNNSFLHMISEGHVYTVRDVIRNPTFHSPGYGIQLESVWLPKCDASGIEETWHPKRFRPCLKTDISVFTEMLKKVDEGIEIPEKEGV